MSEKLMTSNRNLKNKDNARKRQSLLTTHYSLLTLLLFIICSCPNTFTPDSRLPPGYGAVSVNFGQNAARTILPTAPLLSHFDKLELIFTVTSAGVGFDYTHEVDSFDGSDLGAITLAVGTYDLLVNAYRMVDDTSVRLAWGVAEDEIEITNGGNTDVHVTLTMLMDDEDGTFSWDIEFDTTPVVVSTATMTIYKDDVAVGDVVNLMVDANLLDSRELDAGTYTVVFRITGKDDSGDKEIVWHELLYVYSTLTSEFEFKFTSDHFYLTKWTVSFVDKGYSASDYILSPQTVLHGYTLTSFAAPSREGCVFEGWFPADGTDNVWGDPWNFANPVHSDMTLYAKWTIKTGSADFVIDYIKMTDGAPDLESDIVLSRTGKKTADFNVTGFDKVRWHLGSKEYEDDNIRVTLDPAITPYYNVEYDREGKHFLTVFAQDNKGFWHSKTVWFQVVDTPSVSHIMANYEPGLTIYPDTPVDRLKANLTVTAYINDGSPSYTVGADDYTLTPGTLNTTASPWLRTIIVSYSGRTTEFETVVTPPLQLSIPRDHPTLADAIVTLPPGAAAIIRLEEDITIPNAITVDADKDITIISESGDTTISLGANGNMFTLSDGTLRLGDDDTPNTLTLQGIDGNTNSLIRVTSGGTLEMNDSAVITGNVLPTVSNDTSGAGVHVGNGGVFNMNGGKITDCTAHSGGAIRINTGGTATISGSSEISGNTGTYGGAISISNSILTIEGDVTIHSNTVTVQGGAISMNGEAGIVNMRGGYIYNNTASGGGGVYVQAGTFNFYGGIIYGTDGLTQTHSPPREPNKSNGTSAALSVGSNGTAQYGDGEPITTTNDTIVGRMP